MPVITIDDEIVVGFNQSLLDSMLVYGIRSLVLYFQNVVSLHSIPFRPRIRYRTNSRQNPVDTSLFLDTDFRRYSYKAF